MDGDGHDANGMLARPGQAGILGASDAAGGDSGGTNEFRDAEINAYQDVLNERVQQQQSPQQGESVQVAQAFAQGTPAPAQTPQVTVTYDKNVPAMQPKTQDYVEKTAAAAGVKSINISATTNGEHAPNSNHYNGTAVDINKVNGERVIKAGKNPSVAADVSSIQNAANNPKVGVAHENYGPAGLYKGGKQITNQKLQSQHENHIHITIPRSTNDD